MTAARPSRWWRRTPSTADESPWEPGVLPRMRVEVRALSRRDRRQWWAVQRRVGRQLLKQVES